MHPSDLLESLMQIEARVLGLWAARIVGSIVITAILVWGLRRLVRIQNRLAAFLQRMLQRRGGGLMARSADILYRAARTVLSVVRIALSLSIVYVWLATVTILLDPTRRLFTLIVSPLVSALETVGVAAVEFIPNLAMLVVIVGVARFATRMAQALAEAIAEGEIQVAWLDKEATEPTRRLVTIVIWLLALVVGGPYLPGSSSKAFQGIGIVLGVLVSLGSGSAAGNLLAGLVLMYSRVFRPGDRVKVGETIGDVVAMGAFNTRIRTIKDEEVVVPNSIIQQNPVVNYSRYAREHGVQIHTTVTIGYASPWRKVHQLLIDAALATEGIVTSPSPYVLQRALGDFYVTYEICAFCTRPAELHLVEGRLCEKIQDVFARGGIEIMSPHYTNLRDGSPSSIAPEMREMPREAPVGTTLRPPS